MSKKMKESHRTEDKSGRGRKPKTSTTLERKLVRNVSKDPRRTINIYIYIYSNLLNMTEVI